MTYDTQGRRIIGPQSTFEGECKALRAENERLRANLRDSEDAVNWAVMTKNMATDEVKQLRARVAELEVIAVEYRDVLRAANNGPDLHCGFYTAKDYRFRKDRIATELQRIGAALQQQEGGE